MIIANGGILIRRSVDRFQSSLVPSRLGENRFPIGIESA